MKNHQTKIIGNDETWQGKCACRAQSLLYEHRWEAEDWNRAHLEMVGRVRAHLKSTPSLKDQRDWYRKQAGRATDEDTREQWLRLADELDHRLGTVPLHDDSLF